MESLNPWGSTCRLTGLPFTSWVKVASLWQARHSSAAGLGGCLAAGGLPAASRVPADKRRVRATPDAKIFRIVRVDMTLTRQSFRIERFVRRRVAPPVSHLRLSYFARPRT